MSASTVSLWVLISLARVSNAFRARLTLSRFSLTCFRLETISSLVLRNSCVSVCKCVCVGGGGVSRCKMYTTGLHFEKGVTLVFDNSRRENKFLNATLVFTVFHVENYLH